MLCLAGMLLFCLAAFFFFRHHAFQQGSVSAEPRAEKRQPGPDRAGARKPVILLTGFEPFGKGRLPNPSWEGIKQLDGQDWKGHQLVCKQARVVWGSPREQLEGWIEEYRPVAILSFGQGGPGGFALESKASNLRGKLRDNRGDQAAQPTIVKDGPDRFAASIDCEKYTRRLSDRGYPTCVSSQAGQYLCEEMLYSLEYLKHAKKLQGTVLFCHVPPLGVQVDGKQVTVDYVQQFIEEMLKTWYTFEASETKQESSLLRPKSRPRAISAGTSLTCG